MDAVRSTRDIGRSAVREELARVALPQFIEHGFDEVTFDELATRAGVSRSTLLRYFTTKEELVLLAFDPVGDDIVSALSSIPGEESEWDSLRRALEPAIAFLTRSDQTLELMRLIWATPALYSRLHEKQAAWRARMVQQLTSHDVASTVTPLARRTRVAAALECLTGALETWLSQGEQPELGPLLDRAFEAIRDIR